ncbi:hypothetical protein ACTFIW_011623 [Dictyostelium discoideum]
MMQFFGTIVTKEEPTNLVLDEGDLFHLTKAIIHPKSQGKGKVYLTAVISLMEEDEMEEEDVDDEEESPREDIVEIPIGILEAGKTEQIDLNLHYNFGQIVRFELHAENGAGYIVALSGSIITMEQGGCDDEDCDDEHCFDHEDDEEIDSDEEFGDSDQDEEDSDDEEIPQLIAPATKKGKITEIPEVPESKKEKTPEPKKVPEPKKEQVKQPTQPTQPQQKKAAAQQPEKANNKPATASPAKPQNNQSKNAPKQQPQQQQSPAKNNNNKRPQNQNENNKKKQKN